MLTCLWLSSLQAPVGQAAAAQATGKMPVALCGPACLYLAAKRFGEPRSLPELAELSRCSSENGTSLGQLEEAARALGWYPMLAEIPAARFPEIPEPAIVHVPQRDSALGHFVLLLGDGQAAHFLDPAGVYKRTEASRLPDKPATVLILCHSWPSAHACRYQVLCYQSPWRARALAGVASLGVCIAMLTLIKLGTLVRTLFHWPRPARVAAAGVFLGCLLGPGCRSQNEPRAADTAAQEATRSGPLTTEESTFDAGSLPAQASFTHVFAFQNQSDHVVKIARVDSSCSCLKAELLTPAAMAAGARGEVKTTTTVESGRGVVPEVRVLGEDGKPLITFKVLFHGLYRWCAEKEKVYFGALSGDAPVRALLALYLDPHTSAKDAARTLRVSKPCPWVDVEVVGPGKPRDGAESLLIRLGTKAGIPPADQDNVPLELCLTDSKGAVHTIPVKLMWTFVRVLSYYPLEVVLIVSGGKLIGPSEITFQTPGSRNVTRAVVDSPLLTADVELVKESAESRAYRSRLRLTDTARDAGLVEGTIKFYEPTGTQPVLQVPYRLRVSS